MIEQIIENITESFINYFKEDFHKTKEYLQKTIKNNTIFNIAEKNIYNLIKSNSWKLCGKTFVFEFHKFRENIGIPIDPNSSEAFSKYIEQFDVNTLGDWFNKYPFLKVMCTQKIKNICSFSEQVWSAWNKDYDLLVEKKLVFKNDQLTDVQLANSDPHNGSKEVLYFIFQSGNKLLFKPHSLEINNLYTQIFNEILQFNMGENNAPIPLFLTFDNYGWEEFIERKPLDVSKVKNAFFNLGFCSSLFGILGATDLHDENIIFRGEVPYVVDLETGLTFPTQAKIYKNNMSDEMTESISNSIVSTSILPAKSPVPPYGILIGAINTPYPQKAEQKYFRYTYIGTDAMDIKKSINPINRSDNPILLKDGRLLDPLQYQGDFICGYREGYRKIKEKSELIINIIIKNKCDVRIVIRPTAKYGSILEACLFPDNLVSEKKFDEILNYLPLPSIVANKKTAKNIRDKEFSDIKSGDIPYFSAKSNETKSKYGEMFSISANEKAIKNLKNINEKNRLLNERLIAEGFSEIRLKEEKYNNRIQNIQSLDAPIFINAIKKTSILNPFYLINFIQNLEINVNNKIGWLNGVYGHANYSYMSAPFCSLHDTGGLIFLFEHLLDEDKNKYFDEYQKIVNGSIELSKLFKKYKFQQNSLISGIASLYFAYDHNLQRSVRLERLIDKANLNKFDDLFMGDDGLILALSSFKNTSANLLKQINLIYSNKNIFKKNNSLAHGNLGRTWAKFRLFYKMNKINECKCILDELIEKNYAASWSNNGWCNGKAGLLMFLAEMVNLLNYNTKILEPIAEDITYVNDAPVDFSICHGASGILQTLLFVYRITKKRKYLDLANYYWKQTLKTSKMQGFYTGIKNIDYLLGYFLGWGGVADSALLLLQYNEGKLPWIPLALSSTEYQKNLSSGGSI